MCKCLKNVIHEIDSKTSTKIENTLFRYETTNVKTNRMVSTNWTYHKEQSFASKYFIFLKI